MKAEYDFSRGKRGQAVPTPGKTRITIYIDNVVLERFRSESKRTGKGYQTLINETLTAAVLAGQTQPESMTDQIRKIVKEELAAFR